MATREEMSIVLTARDQTAAAFTSLRRSVGAVQVLLAALGGQAAFQNVRRAVSALDDLGDSAERLGTSATVVQALRYQIGQSGGNAEMADRAFDKFADSVAEAANKSNSLSELLKVNGISLRDGRGNVLGFNAALEATARVVAGLPTPMERIKAAADLFGQRAGPKMVGTLEEIARRGLPAVIQAAKDSGQVIDESMIRKASELDAQFQVVERRLSNAFKEFMVRDGPLLISIIDALGKALRFVHETIEELGLSFKLIDPATMTMERLAAAIDRFRRVGADIPKEWTDALQKMREEAEQTAAVQVRVGASMMPLHESFRNAQKGIEDRTRAAQIDVAVLGLEAGAQERLRTQMQLTNVMTENGIALTPRYAQAIDAVSTKAAEAASALDKKKKAWEGLNDAARFAGNQLVTVIEDVMDRTKSGADIARAALKALINQLLQAAILGEGAFAKILGTAGQGGGTGGVLGHIVRAVSGVGGSLGGGGAVGNPSVAGGLYHSGGLVGMGGAFRSVPAFAFAGAPRFHSGGMVGDEMPVIARRGEEIGWPQNLARKYGGGGTQVNVHNYSGSETETRRSSGSNGEEIIDVIVGKVGKRLGRGDLDAPMKRYGGSPVPIRR